MHFTERLHEYPIGLGLGEVVIAEPVQLDEQRAVPELRRISTLDQGPPDRFGNANGPMIELARRALERLKKR